jgi:hypothetical protein
MGGNIANSLTCIGGKITLYTIVFGKPEEKRAF